MWGLAGAILGGPLAVLCFAGLGSLRILLWDPPGRPGHGNPHAAWEEAFFYGGIVFPLGLVLGAFIAVKLARRTMPVWGWGVMGAVIGTGGALLLAVFLVEYSVDRWGDPEWFVRYEVTLGQPQRPPWYFLLLGMALLGGTALGTFVGMKLGRRTCSVR